jgi:hypothetical protein
MKLGYFIDTAFMSLNKYGEELCGDHVETIRKKDSMIIVLSDGLGSGVKANILATLTAKIAVTMLKEGAPLAETIDTIASTLPECSVRKLAYSTFTIIEAFEDGRVSTVEFDNPAFFLHRGGRILDVPKRTSQIHGKTILKADFVMGEEDLLTVVSDGVIHAGVGKLLNLGWKWENVESYLRDLSGSGKSAGSVVRDLLGFSNILYDLKPGDDTTVLALRMRKEETVNLFTGPPRDRADDERLIRIFKESEGKKVISGGTTAKIIAEGIGKALHVEMDTLSCALPPTAVLEGADLVTEGVLTLSKTMTLLETYADPWATGDFFTTLRQKDGAARLAKMIIEDCTRLNIWMGSAVNPAHQDPDSSIAFNIKRQEVEKLVSMVRAMGREVELFQL